MHRIRTLTILLLTLIFTHGAAFADSGKDESGKGRKQFKEFRKQQEKIFEKRWERAEELREKEQEQWEEERERQEEARERYWEEMEERRERAEERAEEWRERYGSDYRRGPYRYYGTPSESYGWYRDFQPAPDSYYYPRYDGLYHPGFRYDQRYRSYDVPQRYDNGVEGVYTPFGYYEEYDWHPYWNRQPHPKARGRIGPFRFEVWED